MGGGGASPGAAVLHCESAGLGWPPNIRTPCAGLPRRLQRGACRGGVQVSVEPITFALLVGNLSPGFRPDRALWTREEVLNWVAFKVAAPNDLTGYTAIAEKWGSEPTRDRDTHEMQTALTALAQGRPIWISNTPPWPGAPSWVQSPPPPYAEVLADRAQDLVRHRQTPADVLAGELRIEMQGYCERRTLHQAAQKDLTDAEVRAEIASRLAPNSGAYAGRDHWTRWYLDADVLRLWPALQAVAKPTIAGSRLKEAWAKFVSSHVEGGTRPNVPQCKAAMVDAFPNHAQPTDKDIDALRAEHPTPSSWTKRGRHKNRN